MLPVLTLLAVLPLKAQALPYPQPLSYHDTCPWAPCHITTSFSHVCAQQRATPLKSHVCAQQRATPLKQIMLLFLPGLSVYSMTLMCIFLDVDKDVAFMFKNLLEVCVEDLGNEMM